MTEMRRLCRGRPKVSVVAVEFGATTGVVIDGITYVATSTVATDFTPMEL